MPDYTFSENTTAQKGTASTTTGTTTDVKLPENDPAFNYDTFGIDLSKFGSGDHAHTLIKFDISSIPGSETITSAKLFIYQTTSTATYSIACREMLQSWGETTATWDDYDGTNAWNTGGALGAGTDRTSTAEDTTSFDGTVGYDDSGPTDRFFDISTLAQAWHSGSSTNNGVHLERNDAGEDSTFKNFTDSEGTDGQRPELVIVTTSGGGGGTPPMHTLLGVG